MKRRNRLQRRIIVFLLALALMFPAVSHLEGMNLVSATEDTSEDYREEHSNVAEEGDWSEEVSEEEESDSAEDVSGEEESDSAEDVSGEEESDSAEDVSGEEESDSAEDVSEEEESDSAEDVSEEEESDSAEDVSGEEESDSAEEISEEETEDSEEEEPSEELSEIPEEKEPSEEDTRESSMGIIIPAEEGELPFVEAEEREILVSLGEADLRVIPDEYNTGCGPVKDLIHMKYDTENPMMAGDILIIGSGGNTFVLDFGYRNKEVSGTVYIENYDFSDCSFRSYHEDMVDRKIHVVFNNCKFSSVSTGRADGNVSFEFNNCTMNHFNGSNSTFSRCQFGHSVSDGMVPFRNVEVNDCFFYDFTDTVSDSGTHIDGTQIYGVDGLDVSHVYFNNCRFEIPPLKPKGTTAGVNACIMLQLEYSSGNNIKFTDCRVNGGSYAIYAESKFEHLTFENVQFEGIRFGDTGANGIIYPKISRDIDFTDIGHTDLLYVSSVWKDENGTHFSVTNDTGRERTLVIDTDQGVYSYTVPACYVKGQFTDTMRYRDFPFDLHLTIAKDCEYVVCYDNTIEGNGTQIRFVNWGGEEVYLSNKMVALVASADPEEIIVEGMCGKDVSYRLNKAGVMTLSGTGATDNYHSQKHPEWSEYKDLIKELVVEEGVTTVGNQMFRDLFSLEKVSLPSTLVSLGSYSFAGCTGLEEFRFPANIETVGGYILNGTVLRRVTYAGDGWDWVKVDSGNDNWLYKLEVERKGLRVVRAERDEVYTYTGSAICPDILVYNNQDLLTEGVDYTVKYSNNIKASTAKKPAKITITGKGNLSGSASTTFEILPKDIAAADVFAGSVVVTEGSKAKPVLTYNDKTLGTSDYTQQDASKKYTEDGTMVITGKGNFTGSREIPVKVVAKADKKQFVVTVGKEPIIYNGKNQRPSYTVTDKSTGESLRENRDYKFICNGNMKDAGKIKFTIVGLGNYTGTVNKTYVIKPLAARAEEINVSGVSEKGYEYSPAGVTLDNVIKVDHNGSKLKLGIDYKISYSNHKKVSTDKSRAKYTVKFIGNYKGTKSVSGSYKINTAPLYWSLSELQIVLPDTVYKGKPGVYATKPMISVGGVLLKSSDYTVSCYKDSKRTDQITSKNKLTLEDGQDYATVYVKIVGKGKYAPTSDRQYLTGTYKVCRAPSYDLSKARVTFWDGDKKITKAEYTGNAITPIVKVEVKSGKTWKEVPADQYTVHYFSNKNKGTAQVCITAAGTEYAGSKTAKFKIVSKNIKSIKDLLTELFGL